MRDRVTRRATLVLVLAGVALLGVLLGSGVALADDIWRTLSIGWNDLEGDVNEYPYWMYTVSHWEYMNSARTEVEVFDTAYTDGWSSEVSDAEFGVMYIFDEYGRDTGGPFFNFAYLDVDDCDYYATTYWDMDELDDNDNYAVIRQYIWDFYGAASDYVIAYTGRGTP